MNNKYIVANLKMNMSLIPMSEWIHKIRAFELSEKFADNLIIAPSNVYLDYTNRSLPECGTCAQDVSIYGQGAHTGATGVFQIKDFCDYCLIGHSEIGDNIETKIEKIELCITQNVTPIVCFHDLKDIELLYKPTIILAYEDPQNISKEGVYVAQDFDFIRRQLAQIRHDYDITSPILYGGSTNRYNAKILSEFEELDGLLIGNAALDVTHLRDILELFCKSKS